MTGRVERSWLGAVVLAALLGVAATLQALQPSDYYTLSQEDGLVEWATVWAFLLAAAAHLRLVWGQRGVARSYGLLVAAFCVVVAMEEISWGQRLLGFRPPTYFLEHNAQQELTWHNQVDDRIRKLALQSVLLGYGVLLPLLPLWRTLWRRLETAAKRLGIAPPPAPLAAGFALTSLVYATYPFRFVGEWVELALGLGLLAGVWPAWSRLLPATAAAFALALATEPVLQGLRPVDPQATQHAVRELAALHRDWNEGRLRTKCGVHGRLFHVVEEDGLKELRSGRFTGLPELSTERARYFLDPWEQPYWVMDRCEEDGTRRIRVYSFGPNRRRDSTSTEVRDDDVAETILEWVAPDDEEP